MVPTVQINLADCDNLKDHLEDLDFDGDEDDSDDKDLNQED
jgi:hypothetical protein